MRIRAVCFDFDGTLAYMRPSHWALYAEAARAAGIEVTPEALAAVGVDSGWTRWDTPLGPVHLAASASQATFRELRAEIAIDRIRAAGAAGAGALREAGRRAAILEEEAARYVLFDDALPALRRLAEAGIVSVVVSNHVWALPEIVAALGLAGRDAGDLCAGIVTSARCGYRKPHPEIFRAALRLISAQGARAARSEEITPHEIIMVGDSVSADVRGAEGVGMHAVLLDRAVTTPMPADVRAIRSLLDVPLTWSSEEPSN